MISLHDGLLFASHSQVDELFEELEDDVKTAIQSKYGNPNDMTTLWDTAMKEVLNLFLVNQHIASCVSQRHFFLK